MSKPPRDFELDHSFRDSHIVVSSLLRYHQAQIQVLTLIDSGASGYAFIDQNFAHQHSFPLHKLKHPRRLFGFDGRPARTGDITHVAETTLVLGAHTEKIFLFVTGLQHYPVVLGHPWLRRHGALADFANNDLLLSSEFCLNNCAPFPVKVKAITPQHVQWRYLPIHSGFCLSIIKNATSSSCVYSRGRRGSRAILSTCLEATRSTC